MPALRPHLKAILAAYVDAPADGAPKALLREVDSATADYEKHQADLFAKFVAILDDRRKSHLASLEKQLLPSEERRRPEASGAIKAVVKDIVQMHKQLRDLLSRPQLHTVFAQVLAALDAGLLGAYKQVDASALFTRQCIVADVLHLRTEVTRLNLALPQFCPELTGFAKGLDVAAR